MVRLLAQGNRHRGDGGATVTLFVKKYKEPSARMYIEEPGSWRSEREVAHSPYRIHFNVFPEGRPTRAWPPSAGDQDEYEYNPAVGITSGIHWGGGILPWGMPIDQRLDEAYSLVYTSEPLEQELEVTGTPAAVLYVSSSAEVAYFRVKLIDVAPDGTSKLVRYGGLNATHRSSHFDPEPLEPGQVYKLQVDIKAMSYVFSPRHRIRVAIASADIQNAWPTPLHSVNTVYRGRGSPIAHRSPRDSAPESRAPQAGFENPAPCRPQETEQALRVLDHPGSGQPDHHGPTRARLRGIGESDQFQLYGLPPSTRPTRF